MRALPTPRSIIVWDSMSHDVGHILDPSGPKHKNFFQHRNHPFGAFFGPRTCGQLDPDVPAPETPGSGSDPP